MDMVNFELLAVISIITALTTECTKRILNSMGIKYVSNIIAVISSVVISAVMCVIKPLVDGAELSAGLVLNGVIMAFFAVLAAMLGYDKIIQSLKKLGG